MTWSPAAANCGSADFLPTLWMGASVPEKFSLVEGSNTEVGTPKSESQMVWMEKIWSANVPAVLLTMQY